MNYGNNLNITTRSDVIFKNIFGSQSNKKLLESLLEAILGKKVDVVRVEKSKELEVNNINDKVGVLDVHAVLKDGTIINIEMQNKEYPHYKKRVLFYSGKMVSKQIEKGEDYSRINDVISINILGYKLPWCKDYFSKYEISATREGSEKIEGMTIYFLQIPRFEEEKGLLKESVKYDDVIKSKLDEWMAYFSFKNMEVLDMVKVKNMDIEEALELYEELTSRKDVVDLYESRLMADMDNRAIFNYEMEKLKEEINEEKEKINEEKEKVNEEKEKVNEEKEKVNEEKERVNEEKEKINEEREKMKQEKEEMKKESIQKVEDNLMQLVKNLIKQNISNDIILKVTGLSENKLKTILASD